jgi:hypothetical protein
VTMRMTMVVITLMVILQLTTRVSAYHNLTPYPFASLYYNSDHITCLPCACF